MKISKKTYLQVFGLIVIFLAVIRCIFPSIAESKNSRNKKAAEVQQKQELPLKDYEEDIAVNTVETTSSRFFKSDGTLTKNPIYSVPHFG